MTKTDRFLVSSRDADSTDNNATMPGRALDDVPPQRRPSTGVLTSFWYYADYDFARLPVDVPLIMDSGAFSAWTSGGKVTLEDYAAWLRDTSPRWAFAFNLDVIGDEAASFANWSKLLTHGALTTPVIHFGDRPEEVLPRYFAAGADRLAISGGAMKTADINQVLRWQAYVHRWIQRNRPQTPVHGLGVHMRSKLAKLPWATTDSSAFTSAWRFARLGLWTGKRWFTVPLDGRSIYRHGNAVRSYGFDPSEVATSNPQTREHLVRLATRIECRAAEDWNTRWAGQVRYLSPASQAKDTDPIFAECDRFVVDTYANHITSAANESHRFLATTGGKPQTSEDREVAIIAQEASHDD